MTAWWIAQQAWARTWWLDERWHAPSTGSFLLGFVRWLFCWAAVRLHRVGQWYLRLHREANAWHDARAAARPARQAPPPAVHINVTVRRAR